MNKKWLTVVVLVCMLAAAVLPPVSAAGWYSPISCGLGFDSAHDSTECVWRILWNIYRIPAAGGDATLLIGAYSEWRPKVQEVGDMPEAEVGEDRSTEKLPAQNVTLSPGAYVTVKISDQADPSHVLFSFEGTLAELMALSGGATVFSGPYGVSMRFPLSVPAGNVLWVGRMELTQGNYRSHADLFLCQGVPLPWPFFKTI